MFSHLKNAVQKIEGGNPDLSAALMELRKLSLDEYGQILASMPCKALPTMSGLLPAMTPENIQKEWTGSSGDTLLRQSVSFMNFLAATYTEMTGRPLMGSKILDFGCGWGRLLRLLAYYNDPQSNYGCDAWAVSIGHCNSAKIERLANTIVKSDEVPEALPFPSIKFDLIYAFSIFTHLSPDCAAACMSAIRKSVSDNGIAVISVRPIEFWSFHQRIPEQDRTRLTDEHASGKIAFYPAGNSKNYGDTSIPLDIISSLFQGWSVVKSGATMIDPYQIFVVLRPN